MYWDALQASEFGNWVKHSNQVSVGLRTFNICIVNFQDVIYCAGRSIFLIKELFENN